MIRSWEELDLGTMADLARVAVGVEAGSMFDEELAEAAGKHCPAADVARLELARREALDR